MGIPIENVAKPGAKPLPSWMFGFGGNLDYYLNSFDGGIKASGEFRFNRHASAGAMGQIAIAGEFYEVGLDFRFYFLGMLMENHYDDFLRFSLSGIYMEKGEDSYFPPAVSLGYGRDFLFFENAAFAGRFEVRASYIIGEPISEQMNNLPISKDTHFVAYMEFSILMF